MDIIHVLGSSSSSSSIFFCLLILHNFPTTISISESEALLKLKASFENATGLDSWKPGTEPCTQGREWDRVVCANGAASGLRLGNLGLSGNINVDALASLPGLRLISFVSNGFSGPIPDFQRMANLRGLFLSRNHFSGEIPSDYFTQLGLLKKVWLSGNGFSGQVPSSLCNLSSLTELHLEDNQFSGTIPPLLQPTLVSLNISNNRFQGQIPSFLLKFNADSYQGNPGLCDESLGNTCIPAPKSNDDDGGGFVVVGNPKYPKLTFLWALMPVAVVFLAVIIGIVVLKRMQDNRQHMIGDDSRNGRSSRTGSKDPESGTYRSSQTASSSTTQTSSSSGHQAGSGSSHQRGLTKVGRHVTMVNGGEEEFTMRDLMAAEAKELGNGLLGHTYKAELTCGLTVVVKRTTEMNKLGRDQFDAEIRKLGSIKNRNLLALMAYYYREEEKLFIYEHQPRGSLLFMLHGDKGRYKAQLNWIVRLKIIQGMARGLRYLHTQLSSLDLPHGNLKASNVFLTPEYDALLAEYGFISVMGRRQAQKTLAAYKSPEAIQHNQVSPKSDVYCLGVVILEIITGKRPNNLCNGEVGVDIVQWVRSAIAEGRSCSLFDPDIERDNSCVGETEEALQIGVACTECNPAQRLDIAEAVRRIDSIPDGSSWSLEIGPATSLPSSEGRMRSGPDGVSSGGLETAPAMSLHSSEFAAGAGSSHSRRSSHDIGGRPVSGTSSIKSDNMGT